MGGEKMSKSLDNTVHVDEVLKRWRPVCVRYYLGAAHYRSTLEFSPAAMDEATAAYERIERFVRHASAAVDNDAPPHEWVLPRAFVTALDSDLSVPEALGVIHSTVRRGNTSLEVGDRAATQTAFDDVVRMTGILGINPLRWSDRERPYDGHFDSLVDLALEERQSARARGDFASADAIRGRLVGMGITVEDTLDGPRWERH